MNDRRILWWGRFDPDYSRNRILRQVLAELGWAVTDFHPRLSPFGDLEARIRIRAIPTFVWVPCFRQRDLAAAARWAHRYGLPLLFDPLISAYDKQVFERGKFKQDSSAAERLLKWERKLFSRPDIILADTEPHAEYFHITHDVPREKLQIVPVGAEEALFKPAAAPRQHANNEPIEVLFYGSFIPLQGPQVIVEAARLTQGENIRWHLLGDGPLRKDCETAAQGLDNVVFEDRLAYHKLPARIQHADILLGVFGATQKAARVIPNKVYQALACGKPVITQRSPAYPITLSDADDAGIAWLGSHHAEDLATSVRRLSSDSTLRIKMGQAARLSYERNFSIRHIRSVLQVILSTLQHNIS